MATSESLCICRCNPGTNHYNLEVDSSSIDDWNTLFHVIDDSLPNLKPHEVSIIDIKPSYRPFGPYVHEDEKKLPNQLTTISKVVQSFSATLEGSAPLTDKILSDLIKGSLTPRKQPPFLKNYEIRFETERDIKMNRKIHLRRVDPYITLERENKLLFEMPGNEKTPDSEDVINSINILKLISDRLKERTLPTREVPSRMLVEDLIDWKEARKEHLEVLKKANLALKTQFNIRVSSQ